MGLLFLDATGNWSDPANTGYKYLRADGVWAAPDTTHLFCAADGSWARMELAHPGMDTPENVKLLATAAKGNPTGIYNQYKDQLTPAISFGSTYGSHRFRLVATSKENASAGGKAGLVLLAEECMDQLNRQRNNGVAEGGFAESTDLIQTLQAIYDAMDPAWSAIITPVNIIYATSKTVTSTLNNQMLFLPSMTNISGVDNECPTEGLCWDYFAGLHTDYTAEPKRVRKYAGSDYKWWLRSVSWGVQYWMCVNETGARSAENGLTKLGVVPAFCV